MQERDFEQLYSAHHASLWRFAARILNDRDLAEDAVQETFAALWLRRDKWNPEGSMRAHLFAAVRNRALDILRHSKANTRAIDKATSISQENQSPQTTEEKLESESQWSHMARAIAELPDRQREAITLYVQDQLSFTEIAQVLSISTVAARKLVLKGLERLKPIVKDKR